MSRLGRIGLVLCGGAAAVGIARHRLGDHRSRHAADGIVIGDALVYDRMTRWLLRSFFAGVAADVAAVAPDGARVLDVGCGPGHLSFALAGRHGLDVTGIDLDPQMIDRARANADVRGARGDARRPTFLVGDVASLAFPDASFDVVVSTLSMHHWAAPARGLAEIGRVLRPDGRALVWDLRAGVLPFHPSLPDPTDHAPGTGLRVITATPWRWPWKLAPTQRTELVRLDP